MKVLKIRSHTNMKEEHTKQAVLAALWTESLRPVSELGSLNHLPFVCGNRGWLSWLSYLTYLAGNLIDPTATLYSFKNELGFVH